MLGAEKVTFYVGFDTTAFSLHAGSLVPIMAMVHLRRAGHRAIAVVGSGTTMVGDPSGKTEMRQMLDEATIRAHGQAILIQLARYLHFDGTNAIAVDNADWLLPLNYVGFSAGYRPALQRQPDAGRRGLQDPARKGPVLHRIQLPAPPGL